MYNSDISQFNVIVFATYNEEEPRATVGEHVKALEVMNPPEGKECFVIEQLFWGMAQPFIHTCHYFESEAEMRTAFREGLIQKLERNRQREQEKPTMNIEEISRRIFLDSNPFLNHPGHIRSEENVATPWYHAELNDTIDGDWVVTADEAEEVEA